ncbi:MAG: hypothetical protein MK102_11970 [Fuerstiella sp.]|nr:hypothetical protein [Fuerstiella sp.]
MAQSANVKSIDAIRRFAAAVVLFREEAKICAKRLESEMRGVIGWLERDRPGFWKRESELCDRRHAEARVVLHQCRMRRVGDFRPTCFQEQKHVQKCKQQLQFAQQQLGVVKRWTVIAHQEADEYYGRAVQLIQTLERDVPKLIALLQNAVENLDDYHKIQLPDWSPSNLKFGDLSKYTEPSASDGDPSIEPNVADDVTQAADEDRSSEPDDPPKES